MHSANGEKGEGCLVEEYSVALLCCSYSECQILILRCVQVQNGIEDVQIMQKQRTL
jgi:hypothetical protein